MRVRHTTAHLCRFGREKEAEMAEGGQQPASQRVLMIMGAHCSIYSLKRWGGWGWVD